MDKTRREALKKLGLVSLAGLATGIVTLSDASVSPAHAKKIGKGIGKGGGKKKK